MIVKGSPLILTQNFYYLLAFIQYSVVFALTMLFELGIIFSFLIVPTLAFYWVPMKQTASFKEQQALTIVLIFRAKNWPFVFYIPKVSAAAEPKSPTFSANSRKYLRAFWTAAPPRCWEKLLQWLSRRFASLSLRWFCSSPLWWRRAVVGF